ERVRRHVDVLRILVALALAFSADLHYELAVFGELDQVVVGLAVAAEPDESIRVGVDAVLRLGPIIARARPAPALDEVSSLIELQHWRRCHGSLVGARRARSLQHPGMALFIDRDAGDLTPHPLPGQLGPGRVRFEPGNLARRAGSLRRDGHEPARYDDGG